MASINDVFNQLQQANGHLTDIANRQGDTNNHLVDIANKLDQTNNNLQQLHGDLGLLIQLETYADQALFHNSQQNDTIICSLENISRNICSLLNEADTQTRLQTSIERNGDTLTDMYKTTHPNAGLELERLDHLRREIEKCCTPPRPEPPCTHEPCKAPRPLGPPPGEQRPPG